MVYITFNGVELEIPYEQNSLIVQPTIDSTFDSGYFKSIPLSANIGDLDYTQPIPRDLNVRIEYNGRNYYLKTGETHAIKLSYGSVVKYEHRVNLISRTEDLVNLPLENMTVTQPKGDYGTYSRSVNVADETVESGNTDSHPLTFTTLVNTNLSKLNGLDIISSEIYSGYVQIDITYLPTIITSGLYLYVYFNGSPFITEEITIPAELSFREKTISKTYTFKRDLSVGSFTASLVRTGSLGTSYETTTTIGITAIDVADLPIRTNAQVIDKMLRNTRYVLDTESRSRLNNTATENTYNEYTVYDGCQYIASEEAALVKVGLDIQERIWKITTSGTPDITAKDIHENSPYDYDLGTLLQIGTKYYTNVETDKQRTEIGFKYFDNPIIRDPIGETGREYVGELTNYVSALELNTRNVVKPIRYSPFKGGFKSLRNASIGKITTDNWVFETEDPIDRTISVKMKGFACSSASYTILATDEIDISRRVLEEKQYQALNSESDYSESGKSILLKNNTLYYVQGQNQILGMGYTGEHESTLIGTANVVRSLYEVMLASLYDLYGEVFTRNGNPAQDDPAYDGTLTGDLAILMQVEYSNLTDSRARVYKDNQDSFNKERIKYMNESASINESESIGNYGQLQVNRLGGVKLMVTGVCDIEDLAEVGDMTTDGYIYTVVNAQLGQNVTYTYTLVKGYNVISSYIATKSAHRVEEISSSNTVDRTMRYVSKVIFSDEPVSFTTRLIQSELVFSSLFGDTDGIQYGYLECNLSNGETKKIHLSLDSDSKGKTIEIKWKLPNNYSAGLKRYTIGSDIWLTANVPYTDYYGKVNDILLGMYFNTLGSLDNDDYPEASSNDGDDVFVVITDTVDKDAREVLGGLVEIPLMSGGSVRVYNGMAKYNKLVEGSDRIRCAVLTYEPLKNAQKIDLSRVYDVTSTLSGSSAFGVLTVGFTSSYAGVGVAFYNVDTLDLCLVFIDSVSVGSNSFTKYWYIEDGEFGGGTNIVIQTSLFSNHLFNISTLLSSKAQINMLQSSNITIEKGHDTSDLVSIGALEFVSLNIVESPKIQISMLQSSNIGINYEYYDASQPTINFVSKTENSITFTLTNNDGKTLDVYYEIVNNTPSTTYVSVASGETSNEITINSLSTGTSYNLFARTYNGSNYSSSTVYSFTTVGWVYLGSSTNPNAFAYDYIATYYELDTTCPTINATRTRLQSNYPAESYN